MVVRQKTFEQQLTANPCLRNGVRSHLRATQVSSDGHGLEFGLELEHTVSKVYYAVHKVSKSILNALYTCVLDKLAGLMKTHWIDMQVFLWNTWYS